MRCRGPSQDVVLGYWQQEEEKAKRGGERGYKVPRMHAVVIMGSRIGLCGSHAPPGPHWRGSSSIILPFYDIRARLPQVTLQCIFADK